jgi:hypothetical protein
MSSESEHTLKSVQVRVSMSRHNSTMTSDADGLVMIITGVLWQNIIDQQRSEDECMHGISKIASDG